MEMNRLTREADELIRKVVARYNSLYSPSGTISQTELDLLLDDLRQMYEKFKLIGHLNIQHQIQEQRKPEPPREPAAIEPEASAEPLPTASSQVTGQEPATPTATTIAREEITPEPALKEAEPEPAVKAAEPEPVVKEAEPEPASTVSHAKRPEPTGKTLADTFRKEQQTLGEVISNRASEDNSLGSRLGHSTVTDLKSIIGLAEKFAFINELFGGDSLAYEKAIIQLNGSTRLSEAETYLGTLRLNHRWPSDAPMANLLRDLVQRKFNQ